jgi:hypothetical protein
MTSHPSEYYVVHHLFEGMAFSRGPAWGSLTDGPADFAEAWDAFVNGVESPTLENFYVLHVQDDVPACDVTEDWLRHFYVSHAQDDGEDEPDHDRQERHSWEQI